MLADPLVQGDAPLRFWSRERLFSTAARRGLRAPDLAGAGGAESPSPPPMCDGGVPVP